METLEYSIDLSRLEVIALDKSINISEFISMIKNRETRTPTSIGKFTSKYLYYSYKKGKRAFMTFFLIYCNI